MSSVGILQAEGINAFLPKHCSKFAFILGSLKALNRCSFLSRLLSVSQEPQQSRHHLLF